MSRAANTSDAGPLEESLLQMVARLLATHLDCKPDASLALSRSEEAVLRRAADAGAVLVELLDADVTNNALSGGEVFNDRQRGALLACVGYAFGQVGNVLNALEGRQP